MSRCEVSLGLRSDDPYCFAELRCDREQHDDDRHVFVTAPGEAGPLDTADVTWPVCEISWRVTKAGQS